MIATRIHKTQALTKSKSRTQETVVHIKGYACILHNIINGNKLRYSITGRQKPMNDIINKEGLVGKIERQLKTRKSSINLFSSKLLLWGLQWEIHCKLSLLYRK